MKIGIVGMGKVGGAIAYGFNRIGHEVLYHDKLLKTKIDNVMPTKLTFVCVPTPVGKDGACDTSIVQDVVSNLVRIHYGGLIVIKSTVTPGFTDHMLDSFGSQFAFCPEFLRERAAYSDFMEGNDVCIVGTHSVEDFDLVQEAHGHLPKAFVMVTPIEAELAKYFANVFNALRIVFANQFYDVCEKVGANYSAVKSAIAHRHNIGDFYLDVNSQLRAFGGSCLPKDTKAFASFAEQLGLDVPLFQAIVDINDELIRRTKT